MSSLALKWTAFLLRRKNKKKYVRIEDYRQFQQECSALLRTQIDEFKSYMQSHEIKQHTKFDQFKITLAQDINECKKFFEEVLNKSNESETELHSLFKDLSKDLDRKAKSIGAVIESHKAEIKKMCDNLNKDYSFLMNMHKAIEDLTERQRRLEHDKAGPT